MSRSTISAVNVKELKGVLTHMVNNNTKLQANGQVPVAMNVIGAAGLGKTSTIKQVGASMGYKKENVNLHCLPLLLLEELIIG